MAKKILKLAKKQANRKFGIKSAGLATPRLSVPQPNPNPQPPNAPEAGALSTPPAPTAPSAPPTTPPTTPPSSLQDALATPGPLNPQDYFKTTYQPAPGQPDPRDSTYWSNLNKLLFESQQAYQQNQLAGTYSQADWLIKQQDMENSRKSNERKIAEAMMRQNLAYSGTHNVEQADALREHLSSYGAAETAKTREDQAREIARSAILQGLSIDEAAALAEAVMRQQAELQRQAERAEDQALAAASGAQAQADAQAAWNESVAATNWNTGITGPKRKKKK